jgi:hypothetical protein
LDTTTGITECVRYRCDFCSRIQPGVHGAICGLEPGSFVSIVQAPGQDKGALQKKKEKADYSLAARDYLARFVVRQVQSPRQ